MLEYIKRFLVAIVMALFISMMFITVQAHANTSEIKTDTTGWVFPAEGEISDVFASRNGSHRGIDIAGKHGSPIFAAANGKVIKSYTSSTYGNVVFIRHQNGYETVYAHMSNRFVNEGQKVQQGEQIGSMGSTGNSTGVHLHFEIHSGKWTVHKENAIDPFLIFGSGKIGASVSALSPNPYSTVEATVPVKKAEKKTQKETKVATKNHGEKMNSTNETNKNKEKQAMKEQAMKEQAMKEQAMKEQAKKEQAKKEQAMKEQREKRQENVAKNKEPKQIDEKMVVMVKNSDQKQSEQTKRQVASKRYTIKEGDTIWGIAKKYGTSVERIMKVNELEDGIIQKKQTLKVPLLHKNEYLVQKGDTLQEIAKGNNVTVQQLMTWNKIEDPDVIFADQILLVKKEEKNRAGRDQSTSPG